VAHHAARGRRFLQNLAHEVQNESKGSVPAESFLRKATTPFVVPLVWWDHTARTPVPVAAAAPPH
jgi:hypothetical protein